MLGGLLAQNLLGPIALLFQVSISSCGSNSSGATPSKCPRTAEEVSDALEFDAIIVEEVTEVTNECAIELIAEGGEDNHDHEEYEEEEEEEEEDDDEKTVVESVNLDEVKGPDVVAPCRLRANQRDEPDNIELRRALHRAGIDSR